MAGAVGATSGLESVRTATSSRSAPVEVPLPVSENPLCTPHLEAENVHRVYNTIAEHWDHTRYKAWPRVDAFIRSQPPGSLVADLGCGNGKNIPAVKESGSFVLASDMSPPLVRIAADAHDTGTPKVGLLVADCLCTPFRSGSFDAAVSIAVLHHLSTVPRRIQALREAARILRPQGEFLVYCWSYEQDADISASRHRFATQDVLVPFHAVSRVKKPKDVSKTAGTTNALANGVDSCGTAEAAPDVQQRYCHVYRSGELQELLAQVPELEVVDIWFDTGNWCALARRRPD
uniref:Methyltransferase type 11 domain-containing protein n=1 Tax=Noctiluca scintillans TaxID=2966 RepID=A0A7S0ZXW3_NOCSC